MDIKDIQEFGDFSGGITDDQDGREPKFATVLENFELLHNKKIKLRPGSAFLTSLSELTASELEIEETEQIVGAFSLEENSMYFASIFSELDIAGEIRNTFLNFTNLLNFILEKTFKGQTNKTQKIRLINEQEYGK